MLYEVITEIAGIGDEEGMSPQRLRQLQIDRSPVTDKEKALRRATDIRNDALENFEIRLWRSGKLDRVQSQKQIFNSEKGQDRITSYNVCYTKLLRGLP